jgi:hypothetical protein
MRLAIQGKTLSFLRVFGLLELDAGIGESDRVFAGKFRFFENPRSLVQKILSGSMLLLRRPGAFRLITAMYDNFQATDRWTQETLHCRWRANIVAIATRHADAVDIRFDVSGRAVWIAMPLLAWVEQKKRTGHIITDQLAAQAAGRYLKQIIQNGYDNGREMYTMTVDEVLEHVDAVLREAGHTSKLPALVPTGDDEQHPV